MECGDDLVVVKAPSRNRPPGFGLSRPAVPVGIVPSMVYYRANRESLPQRHDGAGDNWTLGRSLE